MKKLSLLILLILSVFTLHAQNAYTRADSIFMTNKTKSTKFIIQNSTKDSTGKFAKNAGGGLLEWRQITINDVKNLSDSLAGYTIYFGDDFKWNGTIDSPLRVNADTIAIGRVYNVGIDSLTGKLRRDTNRYLKHSDTVNLIATQNYVNLHGGGSVGGSNKQIQYNNSGAFAGNGNLLFDQATSSLYSNVTVPYSSPSGGIWFFGTSITAGTGSTGGTRYSTIVANTLGLTEHNFGLSGATLESRSPSNPFGANNMIQSISNIPTYVAGTTRWLVFEFGINDFIVGYTNYNPTNFQTDYTTVIDSALAKGWPSNQIIIYSPTYPHSRIYGLAGVPGGNTLVSATYDSFRTAAAAVAAAKSTKYVEVYNYTADRGGDYNIYNISQSGAVQNNLHPNTNGHLLMAQALLNVIDASVYQNGQALGVGGQSELSQLRLQTKNSLALKRMQLVAVDSLGNVGFTSSLPDSVYASRVYLNGQIRNPQAALPSVTLGQNDILLTQDAQLFSTYTPDGSIYGSLKLQDVTGNMTLKTTYTGGHIDLYTNAIKTLSAHQNGSVWIGGATDAGFSGQGDVVLPGDGKVLGSAFGFFGSVAPFTNTGYTEIKNGYSAGRLNFYMANGVDNTSTLMMRMWNNGHLTIQQGGTFADNGYTSEVVGTSASTSHTITGTGGNGFIDLPTQSVRPTGTTGHLKLYRDSVGSIAYMNGMVRRTLKFTKVGDITASFPYKLVSILADSSDVAGTYLTQANATTTYVPLTRTLTGGVGINTIGDLSTNRTIGADTTVLQTVLNFFPKGDTRYAKVSSLPTGDNPTASIGFTAINGSATTFTRSDGAAKADSSVIRSVANSYSLSGMQTKLNNYLLSSTAASTYAPIASPTFTGTAISPTYSAGTYTGATTNTNFTTNGGNSNSTLSLDFPQITSATGQVRIGRLTNTSGAFGLGIYKGDGTGTLNAYVSGNSNSYINASTGVFTVGSATVGGSKFNVNGSVSIGSGQFTNAAPTDGLLVQGQINSLGGIKLSGNISASAGGNNTFTSVVGDNINQAAATYTDNNTGSSTTLTYRAANVLHQPTLAATNSSVVYTNAATLQIDGAPIAGTNASISNPMSLYVLGGQSVFNGGVSTASSGFFSNANLVGNTVTSTTSISQYQFGGSTNVALRAGFYGSTSSTITSGYSYSAVNFASSPFTTASGSTTPWAANTVINSLGTVTLGGGGASLTNSATLYVGPSISTATNNYGIYSASVIYSDTRIRLKGYTVATLPTGVTGDVVYVTDALTPASLTTVVGGGAQVVPVFYNGTNWIVQ